MENALNERQNTLLREIVEEHIASGTPVGSKVLYLKKCLGCSPATIRNEMGELESLGLISQPHISAGRIPTAKGWEYYIQNLMLETTPSKSDEQAITKSVHAGDEAQSLKQIAKTLAELSHNAAILAFSKDDVYYTGLSNLFHAPEFSEQQLLYRMSEVIDHLDDVMAHLFDELPMGSHVLAGEHNPFDAQCGTVVTKFSSEDGEHIMGILGPVRMPYGYAKGILNFTTSLLS